MQIKNRRIHHGCIFFLLSILILACYSNTFHVPWQLDDRPNITENYLLHINNLQPESLWQTFFAKPFHPGSIDRPIAFLSFALNWYFGQDNPLGYHLVNLSIHILTAVFLYKTILLLLFFLHQLLKIKNPKNDLYFIALLSATLWAINPIQTQAVTYIVQRMASMAALFYILALYHYLRFRQADSRFQSTTRLLAVGLFFILALGCKENSITLLPSLLLIELITIYKKGDKRSRQILQTLIIANICLLFAGIYYLFNHQIVQTFTSPWGDRPFSPSERLLTQPRVLLFYLSQLFFPSPARLSIDHSFPLSTSLLQPWTTLPSIFCIIILTIFAILKRNKWPLYSLSILFFFINHLVESTVIPLELVFEHRNYLPSFFLFLPVAAGLKIGLNYTDNSRLLLRSILLASIPLLLMAFGIGTYIRNTAWQTEESLWLDSLNKSSGNARPYAKLAEIYGWQKEKNKENFNTTLFLLENALTRENPRTAQKAAIMNNKGKLFASYGYLDQAIEYYNQSLYLNPDFITARFDLAEVLTLQGKFLQALEQIDIVIAKNDLQSRYHNLRGIILLWLHRPLESAESFRQAMLRAFVNKERYFFNIGVALGQSGHHDQGIWFLNIAKKYSPDKIRILYAQTENRALAGDNQSAETYAAELFRETNLIAITDELDNFPGSYLAVPLNGQLIKPIIIDIANNLLNSIDKKNKKGSP